MDNRLYKLGCKTGLLNYIDHETPRFYFINANADLDDFDAFCAEITEEYAAEIDQLREALTIALTALVAATSLLKRSEDEKVKPSRAVASNKIFRLMMADYERAEDNARAALLGEKE